DYYNMSFDDSNYGEISEQVMLTNRNNNWVKQLTPRLANEQLFIAVGALHLPEKHGLLKQLRDKGFSVTRL
ncbi:TraB/GumN family protein, partial [Pseudoalteromonas sp. 43-MNA-CIBAN-0464]